MLFFINFFILEGLRSGSGEAFNVIPRIPGSVTPTREYLNFYTGPMSAKCTSPAIIPFLLHGHKFPL